MKLPAFRKTPSQIALVRNELRTAHFIRQLWDAADPVQRRDPRFLSFLVQCGWTNVRRDGSGRDATRLWRNRNLGIYLGVKHQSDIQLAQDLASHFPRLLKALTLVESQTGITNYYKSLRTESLAFLRQHTTSISKT